MVRVFYIGWCLLAGIMVLHTSKAAAQFPTHNQTPEYLNANAFWAWYDNNGLDFSNGTPMHVPTSFVSDPYAQGVSSVSDPSDGSLLFYTNGSQVWDKDHQLMPNGENLKGNAYGKTWQGTCIVPAPGDVSKYYIFSLGSLDSDSAGLYYSVVDMTLNSGNGDLVSNQKNIPVDTTTLFTEAMVVIPGNNCNVWVLTHEFADMAIGGSKNYLAFEITAAGVNTSPVISEGVCEVLSSLNYLSVSPDRSKVAMTDYSSGFIAAMLQQSSCELLRFDPETGALSEAVPIVPQAVFNETDLLVDSYYATVFSQNSDVLYAVNYHSTLTYVGYTLVQLDLTSEDSATINSSAVVIDTLMVAGSLAADLKLYNDTIYQFGANSNFIGKIQQPDNLGLNCDFQFNAIQLPLPYKTVNGDFSGPSDVVYALSNHASLLLDTAVCGPFILRPGAPHEDATYNWSNGSTDSLLIIEGPGTYWVNYTYFSAHCRYQRVDTFHIAVGSTAVPPEITINVDVLGTTVAYATYQWLLDSEVLVGATNSTYVIQGNGDYQVIVSDESGCTDTSGVYTVDNYTAIPRIEKDVQINIYPNPAKEYVYIDAVDAVRYSLYFPDGRAITANESGRTVSLKGLADGIYFLKVFDKDGVFIHLARINKLSQ